MKNIEQQEQFRAFERNGQLVLALNSEIMLPENAPVRRTSAQLEELDYRKLYEAYSPKGRKSVVDPKVMFKVTAYAYECGIYSTRQMEEACRYRVDFMWLLEDQPVPDHSTFSRFRTGRCSEAIEDLFYQYVRYLESLEETDHDAVFIDGTKMESRAGRYTFCWRGSIEKNLARVRAEVLKLTGLKTLKGLNRRLVKLADEIEFVSGYGHHKTQEQRDWEHLHDLEQRWAKYEAQLEIMGSDRNSYSKTDTDATFMRMKEDHMRNGQLKPAYNVQIAVNSEYITGIEAFNNRTDYGTLEPFLRELTGFHGCRYSKVIADAGYESLGNYLYLEKTGQKCFIKPQNYEQAKTRKYKLQIGRPENMQYNVDSDSYTCAEGRTLSRIYESTDGNGTVSTRYRCEGCSGCTRRAQCCRARDTDSPKEIRIKKQLIEKRSRSLENISTEEGIYLRMCRSIQVEGAFALLKTDFGFRRFLTSGKKNVKTELLFLALAFDLKKNWMKAESHREKTHLSEIKKTA